jgi:hypothetical protein
MKRHLLGHREAMIQSMIEGLIAYALGREAEFPTRSSLIPSSGKPGARITDSARF